MTLCQLNQIPLQKQWSSHFLTKIKDFVSASTLLCVGQACWSLCTRPGHLDLWLYSCCSLSYHLFEEFQQKWNIFPATRQKSAPGPNRWHQLPVYRDRSRSFALGGHHCTSIPAQPHGGLDRWGLVGLTGWGSPISVLVIELRSYYHFRWHINFAV